MSSSTMRTKLLRLIQTPFKWDIKDGTCLIDDGNKYWNAIRKYSQANAKSFPFKRMYNVIPQLRNTASKNEKEQFDSMFPDIVKDLTEDHKTAPEVQDHYIKVLVGNVPNHKQASGLSVVTAYKAFELEENLTPQNIYLSRILGWCVDLLLCSWQINDDIMDGSEIRRGLPCWYKNDNVGLSAVNDAVFVQHCPYMLLKKHFTGHYFHFPALDWFNKVTLLTVAGQTIDTMCMMDRKPRFKVFTVERLKMVTRYKGTYPQILTPILLAMQFVKQNDDYLYKQTTSFLFEMGNYFEAQNDILDCYGDPSITGKIGSDICNGKCTWLIIKAMEKATKSQKEVLKQHYGRTDLESELKIKSLYEDLGILDDFLKYEEESYNQLRKQITQMPKNFPQDYFITLMDTMYGRDVLA